MKCFRKLVQISVIMGLVICLLNMTVMAQDVTTYVTVQQENDIETYASVPDGYVFLGTFDSTPHTYSLGVVSISRVSALGLYLPKGDGGGPVTAELTFIPIGGGTANSFAFTSISEEYLLFDLSPLTAGMYKITITASTLRESDKAPIYYKFAS